MRIAMPVLASTLTATAMMGAAIGIPALATATTSHGSITALATRHLVPSTYKSWSAEAASEKVCIEMRSVGTAQWIDCLEGHYEAKTGYRLSKYEYTATKAKGTWVVQYSKITTPKGGTIVKKAEKAKLGVPTSVYCKRYKMANGSLIVCSNGTSY